MINDCYIAYVNLDSRPDRNLRMIETLGKVGLTAERVRGLLPSEYTGDPAKIRAMWNRPQKGAIGCHFSQVSIIEQAASLGKHAFVMEDDLVFCSDFHKRLEIIEEFTKTNPWDIIWLGATFHINPPHWHINTSRGCRPLGKDAQITSNPHILRTYGCFCTYAYIINKDSINSVLAKMEQKLPMSIGIDHLMIMLQPDLHTYSFVPGCIKQYDHISDIGVDRHGNPAPTQFSQFAKLGAYWWTDRLEDFDPKTFNWAEAKI